MGVTAYKTAGTCANVNRDSLADWANPDNVKVSDNSRAIADVPKISSTDWLRTTNFGFTTSDIPSGATVIGIEVKIEAQAEVADKVGANNIYLRDASGQVGDNGVTEEKWTTSDADYFHGGAADTWNAGLSDSDVRASTFGVDITAINIDTSGAREARIDCVWVRVYWVLKSSEQGQGAEASRLVEKDIFPDDVGTGLDASHLDKPLLLTEVGSGVEVSDVFTITNNPTDEDSGAGVEASSVDYEIFGSDSGDGIEEMPARDFLLHDSSPGAVDIASKFDRKLGDIGAGVEDALKRLEIKVSEAGTGADLSSLLATIVRPVISVTPYKAPGTTASVDRDPGSVWSSTDNAKIEDGQYAISATPPSGYTDWLRLTNFGFSHSDIPEGSAILGIEVGTKTQGLMIFIRDSVVRLRKATGQVGDNKATTTPWAVEAMQYYGGSEDDWNAGLADSDIRDSNFGVDISAQNINSFWPSDAKVDFVTIRIWYLPMEKGQGADAVTLLAAMIADDTGLAVDKVLNRLLILLETGQGEDMVNLVGAVGRAMKAITYLQKYHNVNVFTRPFFKVSMFTNRETPS